MSSYFTSSAGAGKGLAGGADGICSSKQGFNFCFGLPPMMGQAMLTVSCVQQFLTVRVGIGALAQPTKSKVISMILFINYDPPLISAFFGVQQLSLAQSKCLISLADHIIVAIAGWIALFSWTHYISHGNIWLAFVIN
jgi:hypothetical protein